jgi:hypothetical protein
MYIFEYIPFKDSFYYLTRHHRLLQLATHNNTCIISSSCGCPAPFAGLFFLDDLTVAQHVQVKKRDLEQKIVTLSQLHVINVQRLHDLDDLAVRWDTTNIHSIRQDECKGIVSEIKIKMMQKMGGCVCWGGIPLNNLEFKTWLHLKMLIDSETPLIDSSRLPPVNCFGCNIQMDMFPI